MFQCDPIGGTAHRRTAVQAGVDIVDRMRGRVSGLAIPQLAVDLPGGGGKITLAPERLVQLEGRRRRYRDAFGRHFDYVDAPWDGPSGQPETRSDPAPDATPGSTVGSTAGSSKS